MKFIVVLLLLQAFLVTASDLQILEKRVPGRKGNRKPKSQRTGNQSAGPRGGNNSQPGPSSSDAGPSNPSSSTTQSTALVVQSVKDPSFQLRGANRPGFLNPQRLNRPVAATGSAAQGPAPASAPQDPAAAGGGMQGSSSAGRLQGSPRGRDAHSPAPGGEAQGSASASGAQTLPDSGGNQGSASAGRVQGPNASRRPYQGGLHIMGYNVPTESDHTTIQEVRQRFGDRHFPKGVFVHENPRPRPPPHGQAHETSTRKQTVNNMNEALAVAETYQTPATPGGRRHPVQMISLQQGGHYIAAALENKAYSDSEDEGEKA